MEEHNIIHMGLAWQVPKVCQILKMGRKKGIGNNGPFAERKEKKKKKKEAV